MLRGIVFGGMLVAAVACQPNRRGVETAPTDAQSAPFVGRVVKNFGQVVSIDEDAERNMRQAVVLIVPSTEISRGGQLVSAELLRPGVRVTVWFTGKPTQTETGLVRATARKVQIDQ
jgi:hypothetical protein